MNVDEYRVTEYDQGQLWKSHISQNDGMCLALCAKWLKLRAVEMGSGEHGAEDRKKQLIDRTSADLALLATVNVQIESEKNIFIDRIKIVLDFYRMVPVDPDLRKPRIVEICDAITSTKRRMYLIAVQCPRYNFENHCLAAYLSRGSRVHFFDPNEGEYYMDKYLFRMFLTTFLAEKYQANDNDTVELRGVENE